MRLSFVLGEIFSGLRRNVTMIVSVVLVTLVSLTFVGSAVLLQSQVSKMKGYWYDKVQVAVYLCNSSSDSRNCAVDGDGNVAWVTDAQRESIEAALTSPDMKPYVDEFYFESQEEALKHFKEQYDGTALAENVTADQLPSSYRIKLTDPEKYEVINERFSTVPGVDSVADQRQILERVFSLMNGASIVAIVIAIVMIVTAVLLIATTIRLSAFTRRRETGIMRLVGASKTLIQLPFVLEGMIAAAFGGLLASGVLWAVVQFVIQDRLAVANPTIAFIDASVMLWLGPLLVLLGVVLAGLSSLITLRRYLKV